MKQQGQLFGLGIGPGDPELITVKSLRLLQQSPVIAYFAAKGKKGNSLSIVEGYLNDKQKLLPLVYPVTTEKLPPPFCYETVISDFYDASGRQVAEYLEAGQDVAVICEGDPFFFGSFMYLHDRLASQYNTTVVPGVCSVLAGAAVLGAPLVYRNQSLTILSGVLSEEELKTRLMNTGAAAIMKLGGNFEKVRRVINDLGWGERALYVERATMKNQRIVPINEVNPSDSPYFSIVIVPGDKWNALEKNSNL